MEAMSPRSPDWTEEQAEEHREALRYLLARFKWRALASELGVSTGTLANWSKGAAAPTAENRERLLALAAKLR
jgi:DNA-binding transcriptional regulator YiaG